MKTERSSRLCPSSQICFGIFSGCGGHDSATVSASAEQLAPRLAGSIKAGATSGTLGKAEADVSNFPCFGLESFS